MKIYTSLLIMFLLECASVSAQGTGFPFFGNDIIFNNNPAQNQIRTATCSAFNGWIYSVYTYYNPINDHEYFVLMRSQDGGLSWVSLFDSPFADSEASCSFLKLYVTGSTVSSLRIILVNGLQKSWESGHIYKFDGNTGEYLDFLFNSHGYSIDCAFENPVDSSTFGLISPLGGFDHDYLKFYHTKDGGASFKEAPVITSQARIQKVRLAFGRSFSHPEGRYFAVWEETDGLGTPERIYTAHTLGDTNFTFSDPIRLDTLDIGTGMVSNSDPVITCQNNFVNNSSSDITEVIFFQKQNIIGTKWIVGYKNLASTSGNEFSKISLPGYHRERPEVIYAPYDTNFYLTFFYNSTGKIPLYKSDIDLSQWTEVTDGFNDDSVPVNPFAKISANEFNEKIMCSWTKRINNGNGIGMYDSQKGNNNLAESKKILKSSVAVTPNPCDGFANIILNPAYITDAIIDIYDINGKKIISMHKNFNSIIKCKVDLSGFTDGIYFYSIRLQKENLKGKIEVMKK